MPVEKLLPDRRRGISFGPAVRSLLPGIGKIRYAGNTEAQGTSLILHHLPTRATLLRLDDLVTAMQIIRDRKGPLLFHCWHGSDRTGAVAAMYRMVFQHVPKQHAIDEMVEGIFGFHMIFDNIIDTIDEADIEHIRQELF